MDKDAYYLVTEDSDLAVEEVPAVEGKAAILCEQADLNQSGEQLERMSYGDIAVLLAQRDDISHIRIRKTRNDTKLIEKPDFLNEILGS